MRTELISTFTIGSSEIEIRRVDFKSHRLVTVNGFIVKAWDDYAVYRLLDYLHLLPFCPLRLPQGCDVYDEEQQKALDKRVARMRALECDIRDKRAYRDAPHSHAAHDRFIWGEMTRSIKGMEAELAKLKAPGVKS